jgi:glycine/D-amino acid oxidase-like deaminating enzyme
MFAASLAAIDCVEQIVAEEQIDCDFQRSGHLIVACKPAHYRALAHEAELLARDFGHTTRAVPPGELRGEIGSDIYHGGLVDETSAGINPARYAAGLAHAATRAGALLHEHTPVTQLKRQGNDWAVQTPRGALAAGAVLVASGAYTGSFQPRLQRKIVPLGSYIIATEPLSAELANEISPRGRMIYDTKRLLYYFRLTPDRRMLFGGRARFFPESPRMVRESAEVLRRGMLQVYPQLRDAKIEYAWGGTLDVAFDLMPHAGQIDGLHFAIGYAGHGVALASYLGSQLGARLAGAPFENPFEGLPFPSAPLGLYDGRPWFLPLVGAWYKLLDWAT